jgi:hypothetical protein
MATPSHHDTDVAPELADLGLADKPDGPGAAAMLAAGIGIFVLGLFTVLSEVSEGIHTFLGDLAGDSGVGPLAGKTIMGVVGFFGSWLILGILWKNKNVDIKRMFWIGLVLGILGAVFMLPPVFLAFA